jgi:hypothetical protein
LSHCGPLQRGSRIAAFQLLVAASGLPYRRRGCSRLPALSRQVPSRREGTNDGSFSIWTIQLLMLVYPKPPFEFGHKIKPVHHRA